MRPSGPRSTRPSMAGSSISTLMRATAAALSRRAVASSASNSGSTRGTSPLKTMISCTSSGSAASAAAMASAVPRGSAWVAKSASAAKTSAIWLTGGLMTTRGRDPVAATAASSTYASMGRPQTGCSTLGVLERMRVPRPAAITTAVRRWGWCVFTWRTGRRSVMGAGRTSGWETVGARPPGCQTDSGPRAHARHQRFWAMTSISTRMSSGRRAASMVVRAGYGSGR